MTQKLFVTMQLFLATIYFELMDRPTERSASILTKGMTQYFTFPMSSSMTGLNKDDASPPFQT